MKLLHRKWVLVIGELLLVLVAVIITVAVTTHQHQKSTQKQQLASQAASKQARDAVVGWYDSTASVYETSLQTDQQQLSSQLGNDSALSEMDKDGINDCNQILNKTIQAENAPTTKDGVLESDYSAMVMAYSDGASYCIVGLTTNTTSTFDNAMGTLAQGTKLADKLNSDFTEGN